MELVKPKLTWAQYWEWRTTISEMNNSKVQVELADTRLKLMLQEAEILRVKTELFARVQVESAKADLVEKQREYERFKKVLEDSLGTTLNGKLIDDTTLEVRDLPDETK